MKRKIVFFLLQCVLIVANANLHAQDTTKFLGNINQAQHGIDTTFLDYWNQITPEWEGKWYATKVSRDTMTWWHLDVMFNLANNNISL